MDDSDYYQAGPIAFAGGDVLVIGTDGIWEAHNGQHEMFGKDRLRETIIACADRSAQEIQDAIISAVNGFAGDAPQEDDITVVVIKAL